MILASVRSTSSSTLSEALVAPKPAQITNGLCFKRRAQSLTASGEAPGALSDSEALDGEWSIRFDWTPIGNETWAYEDDTFDLVVSNQVLEHIPRTDHVLRESLRVLKPGGRFIYREPVSAR